MPVPSLFLQSAFKKSLFKLKGGVLTFTPDVPSKGRVLISHDMTPFFHSHPKIADRHANYWTGMEMARLFHERGYHVDFIDYRNEHFKPRKPYTYAIDINTNLERLAPLLNPDCVKVFHVTAAHWLFQNTAEYQRCLALQNRRHATFAPQRLNTPNYGIECADYATIIGNNFTLETYAYAGKKMYPVPLPASNEFPFPEDKDFDAARYNFIWFGGAGAVHKGLDITLEAFSQMPECHLTIFGKDSRHPVLSRIYAKEIQSMKNLAIYNYLEFEGEEFEMIRRKTIALVYPSCSEGIGGTPVQSMHAGILPIVSYEAGVETGDFGMVLSTSSIAEIQHAVRAMSKLPTDELRRRARAAWEFAQKYYTRANFSKVYNEFISLLEAEYSLRRTPHK